MTTTTSKLTGRDAIDWARANGIEMVSKYADPTEGARDVSLDEAEEICGEDPSLIYVEPRQYTWRTDAASGSVIATSADDALAAIVADGEWAETDSAREEREIADGAWLTIFDADGVAVLRRGEMP